MGWLIIDLNDLSDHKAPRITSVDTERLYTTTGVLNTESTLMFTYCSRMAAAVDQALSVI